MKFLQAALLIALLQTGLMTGKAQAQNLVQNGSFELTAATHSCEMLSRNAGCTIAGWTYADRNASGNQAINYYYFEGEAGPGQRGVFPSAPEFPGRGVTLWALPANANPDGGNFLALDGDSTVNGPVSQSISGLKTDGTQYTLSFSWAAVQFNTREGATTEQLKIDFGSQSFSTEVTNNATRSAAPWVTTSFTFTPTNETQVLSFLSVGTPNGSPPVALLDGVSLVTTVPEPSITVFMLLGLMTLGMIARRRTSRRSST